MLLLLLLMLCAFFESATSCEFFLCRTEEFFDFRSDKGGDDNEAVGEEEGFDESTMDAVVGI